MGGITGMYQHLRQLYGNGYYLDHCETGTDEATWVEQVAMVVPLLIRIYQARDCLHLHKTMQVWYGVHFLISIPLVV